MTPTEARKVLIELKPKAFEALGLTNTPRTKKIFDLAVSFVMWSLVDGAHTVETVLPYLTDVTKHHVENNAYSHLDEPAVMLTAAAMRLLRLGSPGSHEAFGIMAYETTPRGAVYRGNLAKVADAFSDIATSTAVHYTSLDRGIAKRADAKIRTVLAQWANAKTQTSNPTP